MLSVAIRAQRGTLALDVTLDVSQHTCVLVGPNGAGKTSLLKLILGALRADAGRVALGDQVLFDRAAGIHVPVEARHIGYVPQHPSLFPHMSALENVMFALECMQPRASRAQRSGQAHQCMSELGIEALASRKATALSGGEQQKVALARALVARPQALLLDEPLSDLDVHARAQMRAFLRERLTQLAIPNLIVTHDAEDARSLGADIAVMENGRIVQSGAWPDLAHNPATQYVKDFVSVPSLS